MADVPEPDYGEQEEIKQPSPTPPPAEKPAPSTTSLTSSSSAVDAAVRYDPGFSRFELKSNLFLMSIVPTIWTNS